MSTSPLHPQIEALRAAWEGSVRSTISIGRGLDESDWLKPSPCPGWRLKDVMSHLVGIEEILLEPVASLTFSTEEKPWLKNDFGRFNEVAVDLRRERPGAEILDEFVDIVEKRNVAWTQDARSPEEEVFFAPMGTVALGNLLWRRVFDVWAHNQDLRMTLGLSGDLDGKAAALVYRQVAQLLPATFAKRCAAPIGASIAITATGPGGFAYGARINNEGRGEFLKPPIENTTASIRLNTRDWYLLTCGREGREHAALQIDGDQLLAQKVINSFSITP